MGLCIVDIHGEIEGDYDIIGKYEKPKIGHLVRWYETIERENCTIHDPHCKCSECDQEYDPYNASLFNYCPNCGAKMEGVQE